MGHDSLKRHFPILALTPKFVLRVRFQTCSLSDMVGRCGGGVWCCWKCIGRDCRFGGNTRDGCSCKRTVIRTNVLVNVHEWSNYLLLRLFKETFEIKGFHVEKMSSLMFLSKRDWNSFYLWHKVIRELFFWRYSRFVFQFCEVHIVETVTLFEKLLKTVFE